MANNFNLIDIIDESTKVTQKNLDRVFAVMENSEKSVKKTLGIKEMFDDFDSGSDPGEEMDDFRNAAGQGEFDDDEDDEMSGDELDAMDDEGGMGDELDAMGSEDDMGDDELDAMGGMEDELDAMGGDEMDDEGGMGDELDAMGDEDDMGEPDEFDPEGGEKFDSDEFMSRHGMGESKLSLIQMISRQVNEMGGKVKTPKIITPRKDDYVVFERKGKFGAGRVMSLTSESVKIKLGKKEKIVEMDRIFLGMKSKDDNIRSRVKGFKANHPRRNIWMTQL